MAGVGLGLTALVVALVLVVLEQRQTVRERDRARAVADLLVDIFETSDPGRSRGRTVTARELLDNGAASSEQSLVDQPELLAFFRGTIGRTYAGLGLHTEAIDKLRASIGLYETMGLSDSTEAARRRMELGELLAHAGEPDEGERLARQALRQHRRLLGPKSRETVENLLVLGVIQRRKSLFKEADATFRSALQLARELEEPTLVAKALSRYASLKNLTGHSDQAEGMLREAVELTEAAYGPIHPEVGKVHNSLAHSQRHHSLEATEASYRKALEIHRALHKDGHPNTVETLHNLGYVLFRRGKIAEAEQVMSEALDMASEVLDDQHSLYGVGLKNLALLREKQKRPQEAEALLRRALDILRRELGADHTETCTSLNNLARLLARQGRLHEARPLYEEALAGLRSKLGSDHFLVSRVLANAGTLAHRTGRYAEARDLASEAVDVAERALGPNHVELCIPLTNLAQYEARVENLEGAVDYGSRAVQVCGDGLGREHAITFKNLVRVAGWQLEQEDYASCERSAREAMGRWSKRDAWWSKANRDRGTCLLELGRNEEAEAFLLEELRRVDEKYSADDPRIHKALARLLELNESLGRTDRIGHYRERIDAWDRLQVADQGK